MPRLRAVIVGLLLILGIFWFVEQMVRQNDPRVPVWLRETDPLLGWVPSENTFFEAPREITVIHGNQRGEEIRLHYDARGFRVSSAPQVHTTKANHAAPQLSAAELDAICLGNSRILAPELSWEETLFAAARDGDSASPDVPAIHLANAGMPGGCPLLYQLHWDRLSEVANRPWFCLLGPQTPLHDFEARRGLQTNRHGEPVLCRHPHALAAGNPPQTDQPPLINSRLVHRGLQRLSSLFLGDASAPPLLSSPCVLLRNSLGSEQNFRTVCRTSLEPLVWLQRQVQAQGGELILVYVPHACDLHSETDTDSQAAQPALQSVSLTKGQVPSQPVSQPGLIFRDLVQGEADRLQIALIDFTPIMLQGGPDAAWFEHDGQSLSPVGHRKIGQELRRWVHKNQQQRVESQRNN